MASLGRLRLITFDVTNTLLQFRSSPGKQYGDIGALFGVLCDNNDLAKGFKSNWHKMNRIYPNFGCDSRMVTWQLWWRQLIAGTFADSGAKIPADRLENFSNQLVQLYETSVCWQHCNGSLDLLNYLRMQQQLAAKSSTARRPTLVLGVIANFDPRLATLLRNMKIDHFFEFALNSYDSRVEKPNAEIFEMAMRASELPDLKPEECLHIGDGPTTDFLGAKGCGWHAALVHERNAPYLVDKYGERIQEHFLFPSLYDFHKKLSHNVIDW